MRGAFLLSVHPLPRDREGGKGGRGGSQPQIKKQTSVNMSSPRGGGVVEFKGIELPSRGRSHFRGVAREVGDRLEKKG